MAFVITLRSDKSFTIMSLTIDLHQAGVGTFARFDAHVVNRGKNGIRKGSPALSCRRFATTIQPLDARSRRYRQK